MTEIPEHLLKRAQAAREKAQADAASAAPADGAAAPAADAPGDAASAEPAADPRIPAHLLERSRAAKARAEGGDESESSGGGVAVAERPGTAVVAAPPTPAGVPVGAGPGGHTQRLLTVVKSGSIQEVKATPVDKVHTWPHLLAAEFVASLACLAFTFVFSIFVNAPLLELANTNQTPNPSKAPWYFLGLQELLTMFHPMIAGVTIPGVGIIVLIFAPYIDRNPSIKPEDRKFATSLMTMHLMFWAVLVLIGSFFRGPGFNFVYPWRDGLFFDL
jgi:menaquinol-cytochrome c reductase cytochrome b/c subunit